MLYRSVDLVIEGLLGRLLPERAPQRLGRRFQRAAFALAVVLLAGVGTVTLTQQILDQRTRAREAHQTTLEVLNNDLTTQLDGIADEMRFLSQSPLVWTAISDSAGRDSYLRPSLRADSARNRATRLTLLDYRGRLIAGGAAPLDPGQDPALAELVNRVMAGRQPLARVPYPSPRLLLAYPVRYPYTGDAIGVLLAEVSLVALIHGRARSLDESLGLALGVDGRELLAFPPRQEARSLVHSDALTSRASPGLYRFDLTLFHRQPTWLAPLVNLVLVYLAAAVVLIAFTWRATHRLAEGLTRRLDGLARAVAARGGPDTLPDDPSQDEIGTLTRVLRDSLAANRELTQHLEERVTERTRQLADREAQYRFLAENIKDVVWTLDADSLRFLYVSPSVSRLRGYTADEILARPADAGLAPDLATGLRATVAERAAACRAGTLAADRYFTSVLEQPRKDGGGVWTEVISSYRLDPDQDRVVVLGVTRDIGERHRAAELERYGAYQAGLAEMGVAVLHNVGNLVTGMLHDAESLRDAGAEVGRVAGLLDRNADEAAPRLTEPGLDRDEATRQLAVSRQAAAALGHLERELIQPYCGRLLENLTRIGQVISIQQSLAETRDVPETFSLAQALDDVLAMQSAALRGQEIDARLEVDPALGRVVLPRNRLIQALLHVVRNARDAIRYRTDASAPTGEIVIRATPLEEGRFRLQVLDNGIGLAAEQTRSLFQPGFSTHPEGTGYGLHAVAVFVQELGGNIALNSEGPGQGANLVMDLPVDCRAQRERQAGAAANPDSGQAVRRVARQDT